MALRKVILMYKINSPFVTMLQTKIRDKQTERGDLQRSLLKLGEYMATEIIGHQFVKSAVITTPLEEQYQGLAMFQSRIMVISTKDDYNYFAEGISTNLPDCIRGYMDFGGLRGAETLASPIRALSLPDLKRGEIVDTVIVAKSILATGCTAIALLRKAIEEYTPSNIIVASVFYSDQGIMDLQTEVPRCKIYVCGIADSLNKNGMLVPGIGNLDNRLKTIDM